MSFFELPFKIILTLVVILLCFGFLRWIWTHQIDPIETIKRLGKRKAQETLDIFATRDQNAIYQGGIIVGKVSGNVDEVDSKIIFREIFDTSNLNQDLPFEYRRDRLRIISIGSFTGMDIKMVDGKSTIKHNVIKDVVCERIK